ncbi:MAG: ABC transporter ATP-binding protein, partial [Armatimonadota bacterium]
ARALAIRPKVLLLDEPLSALDEQTRDELSDELADIPAQTGACVVHVCHNLEEAARLADRVAVLNRGRIVQVGTAPEVFQRPATRFVAEFVGTRNIFDGTAQPSRAEGMCEVGIGGRLLLAPDVGLRGAVCAAVRPEEIEVAARDSELVGANVFRGRLRKAEDRGAMVHLELDVGVPLVALMSRQVYRRARVKVGDDVRVGFPPNAVHVFAADAGEPPEEGTSAD